MTQHHFLLETFPAQGNINPIMRLAKRLIHMGVHVTIATSVYLHRRMTNKTTIPGLSFATFSDGFDDGFNGSDYQLYLSEARRRGSESLANLIASGAEDGHPFTCFVYNFYWTPEVARGLHLPTVQLWPQPATVFDIYNYFFNDDDYIKNKIKDPLGDIELPGLPLLKRRDLPSFLLSPREYGFALPWRFQQIPKPRVVFVNTFEELEPKALRAIDNITMIPIGPLIPTATLDGNCPSETLFGGDLFLGSNGNYMEWLDSNPEFSVVYVSFGSNCELPKRQMEEIASALLDYGRPFLWVIREKEKKGEGEEDEELSCRKELEKRGKIVTWCSQAEVLSHPSLGCFLTHCGWNSILESLGSGVPMVAFPQRSDQTTNAKLIEDVWKTGVRVEVEMNEEGIAKGEEIRRCLEAVMGSGEKGEEVRRNAKKWKELTRKAMKEGGALDKNIRAFLEEVGGGRDIN